jgi:hypothetical protein
MPKGISQKLAEQRREIAEDVEHLGNRAAVARKWGCSLSYVDRCCQQFDIKIRTNLTYRQIVGIIADLLDPDMTYKQIEDKHQIARCPLKDLNKFCKEAGMDTGRNRGRPRNR